MHLNLSLTAKLLSCASICGSSFITLTYLRFPMLRDFTFLIVVHMAVANALMNLSMLLLHGSLLVPLCSTPTLLFYSFSTSYVFFVSIVSYLLYRKIVLGKYYVRGDMRQRLVLIGWTLPMFFLSIPSAFPRFWSTGGKLVDGCKSLRDITDENEEGGDPDMYNHVVFRLSLFLFLPSACAVVFNIYVFFCTRVVLREGKRMVATQRWLKDVPVVSLGPNKYDTMHVNGKGANAASLGRRYHHQSTAAKGNHSDEYLQGLEYEPNPKQESAPSPTRTRQFGASIPGFSSSTKLRHHDFRSDDAERYALNSTLMDRFSSYPLVLVFCWIFGSSLYAIYAAVGATKFLEMAIFHIANIGMASSGALNAGVLLMSPHVVARWKNGSAYDLLDQQVFFREDDDDETGWSDSDFDGATTEFF